MNGFAISGLFFVAIPAVIIGPFLLIKGRKKIHLIWTAFLTSVAWWGFGIYKIATVSGIKESLFWLKVAEIGVIFIPVFLVHFVMAFLGLRRKILLAFLYVSTVGFLYLNIFTNYFLNDLYFAFDQFYYPFATPIYTLFIFIFFSSVIYSLFELLRTYRKRIGIIKSQIKYLILAFIIGFSGGATSFLPAYKINVYPAWNGTIFVSVLMVSYAILRYRLMDIRVVFRKIFIYIGMAGLTYGLFYLVAWGYIKLFGEIFTTNSYLLGIIVAPLFVLLFIWFNKLFIIIANKYFFFKLYNYQKTINKLTKELNYHIDLKKIIDSIVDTIKDTMQLNRAGVLLVKKEKEDIHYRIAKVIGFNEDNGISLVQDNFLTRYLEKTKRPLVAEEMVILAKDSEKPSDRKSFAQLSQNMKKIEASLCLPLISRNRLIGIIVLGSKISGDAYSEEDLNILDILAKQAAIAIENARLYQQVQNFNKTLKQKVAEQTKEIRKAYEVEKKAHEELKRLDKAKDQFILATQHHLRTPISGMLGYLDLLFGGSFGKIPKKIGGALQRFQSATKILSKLVDEFLDISQLQIGRKVVALKPNVELNPLLDEIMEEVTMEAETKKLSIKLEKDKSLPKIIADPEKLKTALFNIIDNAIKYTAQGGVVIKTSKSDSHIQIEVQDTGKGIPQQDLELLCKKLFERGDKADKFYATGRGIGLFMSTLMIEAHNGKIWAESQGQDKGSSFFIQLPIK